MLPSTILLPIIICLMVALFGLETIGMIGRELYQDLSKVVYIFVDLKLHGIVLIGVHIGNHMTSHGGTRRCGGD